MEPSSSRPARPARSIPPAPLDLDTLDGRSETDFTPFATPAEDPAPSASSDLTPLRAHYLKKSLIQLQFARELDAITGTQAPNASTLSHLGAPFSPPPKGTLPLDLPFLKFIFRQFILTFPFMASAPKDFYSEKLQPFMGSLLSRKLTTGSVLDESAEGSERATRMKLLARFERNLSLFVGSATKLVEKEEVVRLSQTDLDRLEELARQRQEKLAKQKPNLFEVNVICVRHVLDKGRIRSRTHEEFIIRTRRSHYPDIHVSRRYGDFKTLFDELRKAHPDETIRSPPVKDRTTVNAPPSHPMSPTYSNNFLARSNTVMSDASFSNDLPQATPSRMSREKNRLTLRAYLHSLMTSSTIANSPVLRSFLLASPTTLSHEEMEDAAHREDADRVREDGRKRFAKEIASRVEGLREAVKSVKGDIMGRDGITHIFATIKHTPDIRALPSNYKSVLEWARISIASTVFHHFVAADDASETFAGLKRIHGMMPYFMLKTALKVSNPISMIRSVLDLFMAQPFGGQSLLQRMFTNSLSEEVKTLQDDIEAVKLKVDDPVMVEKIRQFVHAPREIQDLLKADAVEQGLNVLTVILRSGDQPVLSRVQMQRVVRAHRAHAAYVKSRDQLDDSDDDDGPQDEDGWLFEDLWVLANLFSRLQDREQLIALVFEGFTASLLKDIVTIFYSPLAQVYKAASIADSLGDLQTFVNDLIRTVEQVEDLSQEDPQRAVQTFIDLIQRHEQSFYGFVHKVHSKGEGLFEGLMRWVETFITVIRDGLGEPISLEFLLPHTGAQRENIFKEVDAVALYHYKLKVQYEEKIRRRFGKLQGGSDADAEDQATTALVHGVVDELSFGELVEGDADDLAAQESDSGSGSDESTSEYETDTDEEESEEDSSDDSAARSSSRVPQSAMEASHRPMESSQFVPLARAHTARESNFPRPGLQSSATMGRPRTLISGSRRVEAPVQSVPPPSRMRTLSLKTKKSVGSFLGNGQPRNSRDQPPLPPLPMDVPSTALFKPLPPSPPSGSSSEHLPRGPLDQRRHPQSALEQRSHLRKQYPTPPRSSVDSTFSQQRKRDATPMQKDIDLPHLPPRKDRAKKAAVEVLKPPDLKVIQELLPMFTEMMRPSLCSRER